jgi:hypothetical protein
VSKSERLKDVELMNNRKLVLGANAASGTKGSVYLGRPWGDYARVIFQNSNFENMITAAGWEGTFRLLVASCFSFPLCPFVPPLVSLLPPPSA